MSYVHLREHFVKTVAADYGNPWNYWDPTRLSSGTLSWTPSPSKISMWTVATSAAHRRSHRIWPWHPSWRRRSAGLCWIFVGVSSDLIQSDGVLIVVNRGGKTKWFLSALTMALGNRSAPKSWVGEHLNIPPFLFVFRKQKTMVLVRLTLVTIAFGPSHRKTLPPIKYIPQLRLQFIDPILHIVGKRRNYKMNSIRFEAHPTARWVKYRLMTSGMTRVRCSWASLIGQNGFRPMHPLRTRKSST
jgi:hypothetical protein